jgi:hypothetical protein
MGEPVEQRAGQALRTNHLCLPHRLTGWSLR